MKEIICGGLIFFKGTFVVTADLNLKIPQCLLATSLGKI
jgi:hypothetical protein